MERRWGRRNRSPALVRSLTHAEAFGEFYDEYADQVAAYFVRRTLDTELALEFVARTFALAFERRRQFRGTTIEEEGGWLFAIARSELREYWRKGRVERDAMSRVGIEPASMSPTELERVEELAGLSDIRDQISAGLDALPAEYREAVLGRIVDERSYAELAHSLDTSQNAIRLRVSRGLKMLREHVDLDEDAAA